MHADSRNEVMNPRKTCLLRDLFFTYVLFTYYVCMLVVGRSARFLVLGGLVFWLLFKLKQRGFLAPIFTFGHGIVASVAAFNVHNKSILQIAGLVLTVLLFLRWVGRS